MRILFDAQMLVQKWSGVGYYLAELVTALSETAEIEELGLSIGLSIRGPDDLGHLSSRKPPRGTRLLTRAMARFGRPVVELARRVQLRQHRRDWTVFHGANFVFPEVGMPLVTTIHDLSFVRCPQYMPADRARWIRNRVTSCLQRSRAILVTTDFVKRELLDCYPRVEPEKIFQTPLGVDHDLFHCSVAADETEHLRSRYKLPKRFVLYVGTLEPRKNLTGLIGGYQQLPRDLRQRYPLVLAGAIQWHRRPIASVLNRLRSEGSLHYLGYVPRSDTAGLMRLATAFLFPSHYEGFGLPPLEAAACGTPVLCSKVASLPEVMGDAAVYVEPASADDIADGLLRLLSSEDLRQHLAKQGRLRAARFNWRSCATATMAAYRAAV